MDLGPAKLLAKDKAKFMAELMPELLTDVPVALREHWLLANEPPAARGPITVVPASLIRKKFGVS